MIGLSPGDGMSKGRSLPRRSSYTRLKKAHGGLSGVLAQRPRNGETAMHHTTILTVDYHDQTCVVRSRRPAAGTEQVRSVPTAPDALAQLVDQAHRLDGPAARVAWVQESTTGWARVQGLLGDRVDFQLA